MNTNRIILADARHDATDLAAARFTVTVFNRRTLAVQSVHANQTAAQVDRWRQTTNSTARLAIDSVRTA